jgi:spore germination protein YaaH
MQYKTKKGCVNLKKLSLLVFAVTAAFLLSAAVLTTETAYAAEYVVSENDTLWLIANRHGCTIEELILANPQLTNPDNIWEGMVINLPDLITDDTPPAPAESGRESLTYLYAGTPVSYVKIIDTANRSLKTICPDYFDVDSSGNLLITPSNKINRDFVAEMHGRGIKVTPFISNHWDREKGNAALDNAEALAVQTAKMINDYDLDGINIDIENVNEKYRDKYTLFTRLLREQLPQDKIVTVAVAANPNGWNTGWHGSYDYNALSDNSDYLMVMAYDESYYGGPAGPISSAGFFNKSIEYAINQGVDKSKIVTGIPFFGRYWKEGQTVGGSGITSGDIEFLVANYHSEKFYDEDRQSANVVITIREEDPEPKIWGGTVLKAGRYNIWYDDLRAIKYKLGQINKYDIRGAGSWALGQENTETWRFYVDALNGKLPEPEPTPTPTPTPSPTPSPTPESTPTPTPTPTPRPIPKNNTEKIIFALDDAGSPRSVTSESTLTRGEFAVLLSELTYLQPEPEGDSFEDTVDYWGKGQINALKRRGILVEASNKFRPNDNIRRDDAAVLLERVLVLPDTIDFHTIKYKDMPLSSNAYNAVSKLCYFDIMTGVNKNFFKPEYAVTVADLAKMLDSIDKREYPFNPDQHMPAKSKTRSRQTYPPNPDKEPVIQPR